MSATPEALFAQRVRARRESLGWTQATLADILGLETNIDLDATAIRGIETGDRGISLNEAAALATVIGADLAWLVSPEPKGTEPTVNQRVAYHIARARRVHGWSQQETAHRLTEATGKPWTYATLSASERSWETGRTRHFHADELAAFATVFGQPVESFFQPINAGDLHRAHAEDRS